MISGFYAMDTPLLNTKLFIPPPRADRVPRPHLVGRLQEGLRLGRKLTVISAPAGFGKTTLLSEWFTSAGRPAGWLSLDEGDNDPARFLAYLVAALHSVDERLGQGLTGPLHTPQHAAPEALVGMLINQAAALPLDLLLALDDYHLITAQTVHDTLSFLLEHQPANVHLVLATRADPPLPVPRLRARGQLTELRQSDLRFTAEEAAAFLNRVMGLGLSTSDAAALEARTEGWIAGLQMAALSLQGLGPHPATRSEFVQAFTGSHRFVLDYLVEEVLEQQPPALQEFLLKTSVLDRLSGPLCDAVAGNRAVGERGALADSPIPPFPDSQSILEYLEAANLFIVSLDHERRWYRYHRLFSDLLRNRLGQTSPELAPILHRRASAWHEQEGSMAAAIDHALAAQDFERAATLIEASAETTLMHSEVATFLNWVERLPGEWVSARPTLFFFHTWALLMSGRSLELVEQRVQDMACAQDAAESNDGRAAMRGRAAALRAYFMLLQADMLQAAELCRQALENLPENDLLPRSIVSWVLSLARLAEGDLPSHRQGLQELARMAQDIGNPLIAVTALSYQARLQMRQGRLHQAHEILKGALQLTTDPQGRRLPIASEALIGLGELEREWNHLEEAANHLVESIRLAGQWSEMASFDAYLPLVRTRLAQGDVEAARQALETAERIAQKSTITEVDDLVAELMRATFCISQGDVQGAMRWAARRAQGTPPGMSAGRSPSLGEGQDYVSTHLRKYEQFVLARLLVLQNRATEALDLLASLLAQARRLGRIDLTIEIQILRALACQAENRQGQAMAALAEALSLAEPGGYLRIFLDEGEPMARLLRQAASRGLAPTYVARLLRAFGGPQSEEIAPESAAALPLTEPLSRRELEVLRLLAAGMSNPEIAGELVVAVSTVRSHCKSIYGKLNVHRRWDAVERGQELGLI